ncbi:hypothetical protein CPAR01_16669 [Colletotrichum paranaense]|uniref:Uncharacterized protein n=1 Tax=Colletotrichum paranaense TaxID=1914294 RepID=A0ABQ9RVK2_9PEZI|nr:uncharacterized protein CPAR01_16669 [Colletotrichum paranaense]KAK1515548.1 hypothetical protein CPAR01_16669 [Colletotrichum paranaense]
MRSICIPPEDNATLCRSYIQLTMSSHIVPRDRFQNALLILFLKPRDLCHNPSLYQLIKGLRTSSTSELLPPAQLTTILSNSITTNPRYRGELTRAVSVAVTLAGPARARHQGFETNRAYLRLRTQLWDHRGIFATGRHGIRIKSHQRTLHRDSKHPQPGNPPQPPAQPCPSSTSRLCATAVSLHRRAQFPTTERKAWMCQRKVFIHHRCGHKITELLEQCETFECPGIMQKPVISNRYTCIVRTCLWYGQF